jgi:23S rRNA pseudouridine2604 synthase
MATIKLKKPATAGRPSDRPLDRPPVRGTGSGVRKPRPTLAEAEAQRAEREARYQEQLRQRFGDNPPPRFMSREDGPPGRGPRNDRPGAPRGREEAPRGQGRPDERARARGFDDPPRPRRQADDPARARSAGPRQDMRDDPRSRPGGYGPRDEDRRPPARRDAPMGRPTGRPAGGNSAFGPSGDGPRGGRDDRRPGSDERASRGRDDRPMSGRDDRPMTARDERRPPVRREAPAPHGPRPSGRNSAFGRDDRHAPPPRQHGPARSRRDDDEDDDEQVHPEIPGSMRLSKRMSEMGIASRREADEWIPKGWVRVDGRVVTELGSRVMPDQQITIDAKARHVQAQRVTVLIHKPVGYVSGQAEDGYEPAYVLVKPENQWREDQSGIRFLLSHLRSLAPAGRLDIDSTGLLVLTQDGRVAKQLIGEDSEIEKEYLVRVKSRDGEPLSQQSLALLNHGLELDGVQLRPAQVEWVNDDQLRFVLREGRKRQIRRMCEAVGLDVLGLKRVRIGSVMLGDLPPGQWRYLRLDERFG